MKTYYRIKRWYLRKYKGYGSGEYFSKATPLHYTTATCSCGKRVKNYSINGVKQ